MGKTRVGKSYRVGKKRKRNHNCKVCKRQFRMRRFDGGGGSTFADTCTRSECIRKRLEMWKLRDAERRLRGQDDDKPPHYVIDGLGNVKNFGGGGITKAAVVGPASTGTVSKPIEIETPEQFVEVFGHADKTNEGR